MVNSFGGIFITESVIIVSFSTCWVVEISAVWINASSGQSQLQQEFKNIAIKSSENKGFSIPVRLGYKYSKNQSNLTRFLQVDCN